MDQPSELPRAASSPQSEPVQAAAAPASPPPVERSPAQVLHERLQREVGRVVVGLEREIESCLVALLAGGHVLVEGPPGVAKTLLVRALATALGGKFGRIQFTPDLMPADITGTSVYRPAEGAFRFQEGPVFANVLLGDEINRAPAKTQAALLEAMQECAVTVDGARPRHGFAAWQNTASFPPPFVVTLHARVSKVPQKSLQRSLGMSPVVAV